MSALPTYIPICDKLPWFQAVCVILPQLPYLREECLRKEYRNQRNLLAGFCYTASEAVYHLSEDPLLPWCARYGPRSHQTHWYLTLAETGDIVDVTGSQFADMDAYALYDHGVRKGFLTKGPSKRARLVLDRIDRRSYWKQAAPWWSPYRAEKRYENAKKDRPLYAAAEKKRKAENSNPTPRSARSG